MPSRTCNWKIFGHKSDELTGGGIRPFIRQQQKMSEVMFVLLFLYYIISFVSVFE